jgi:hypothetical protein
MLDKNLYNFLNTLFSKHLRLLGPSLGLYWAFFMIATNISQRRGFDKAAQLSKIFVARKLHLFFKAAAQRNN